MPCAAMWQQHEISFHVANYHHAADLFPGPTATGPRSWVLRPRSTFSLFFPSLAWHEREMCLEKHDVQIFSALYLRALNLFIVFGFW